MEVNVKQLNSLALAYVGDAVYEVHVRHYLIKSGKIRPNDLHQEAVSFVAATGQAAIIHDWLDRGLLSDEEAAVVRRGRNAKSHSTPKNMPINAYRYATAFEALIGYHYLLDHEERLTELLDIALEFIVNMTNNEEGKK